MRALLIERGATFRFDTKVEGFLTRGCGERGAIRGLKLADGGEILADRCCPEPSLDRWPVRRSRPGRFGVAM